MSFPSGNFERIVRITDGEITVKLRRDQLNCVMEVLTYAKQRCIDVAVDAKGISGPRILAGNLAASHISEVEDVFQKALGATQQAKNPDV